MGKKKRQGRSAEARPAIPVKHFQLQDFYALDGLGIMLIAMAHYYAEKHGREAALHVLGAAAEALAGVGGESPDELD